MGIFRLAFLDEFAVTVRAIPYGLEYQSRPDNTSSSIGDNE
jgi:hypothetical protein